MNINWNQPADCFGNEPAICMVSRNATIVLFKFINSQLLCKIESKYLNGKQDLFRFVL